jgi:hypothetical protein
MTGKEIYVDIRRESNIRKSTRNWLRERCAAAGAACFVPPRHEEGAANGEDFGAEGIKIRCADALGVRTGAGGAYHWGVVPLHTLRAEIDYGFAEANTCTE